MLKGQLFNFLSFITEWIVFHCDMNIPCYIEIKSQHVKQIEWVYCISKLSNRVQLWLDKSFFILAWTTHLHLEKEKLPFTSRKLTTMFYI